MKETHKNNKLKAIVTIVVVMVFVMPVTTIANNEGLNNSEIDSVELCPSLCYDAEYTDVTIDTLNLGDRFYAYNLDDPSGVLLTGPVYFDSEHPNNITLLKESIIYFPDFIAGGTWAEDTWYGCQFSNGALWTINEVTGDMTRIGGGGVSLNGLSYNHNTGNMYGASSYDLYVINMSNGEQTLVGHFDIDVYMIGIAFDDKDNLYGIVLDSDNDKLCSINTSTGVATLIGPLGININYAQDMAFDITWNVLYLSAYIYATRKGALYACDTTIGTATKIGLFQGGAQITGFAIPPSHNHPPETPDRPKGQTDGTVGVEYTFSTRTTDPEEDKVYYMWDWDDGTYSNWLGPFDSGDIVLKNHTWMDVGIYNVTVKSKDIYNRESDWSEPKIIYIFDAPILEIGNITGGLFKVTAEIKNIGSGDATGVDWSITLDGGFILLGKETTGNILSIPAGEEVTIESDVILGIGKTVIMVTAECVESSDTKEQDAFVFLFFIKIITS